MLPANVISCVPVEVWILYQVALAIARLLFFRYRTGFGKYNGPFLASFTDLWRVFHAYIHMNRPPMLDVYWKSGDVVRVDPHTIPFGKPEAIKDIYGPGRDWSRKQCQTPKSKPKEDKANVLLPPSPIKLTALFDYLLEYPSYYTNSRMSSIRNSHPVTHHP